jgi:molybdate transport repressor ModE-like protein
MNERRNALTPEALAMMDSIARTGSFAAAARELGKVPSALTYNVRQLEDALDVLLFDRRSGQAKLTAAGTELLDEGRRLLASIDAVANRVRRVSSGWESHLTIAADDLISRLTVLELCEAFYALHTADGQPHGTRLRLRTEVLAGTWDALVSGEADIAIGVPVDTGNAPAGITVESIGAVRFVFVVAPHHPLAKEPGAIAPAQLVQYRAIAVADSARYLRPVTVNLLAGQDVLTVSNLSDKIEALTRGVGCGYVPEPMVRSLLDQRRLLVKETAQGKTIVDLGFAWRTQAPSAAKRAPFGLGLSWWLAQLRSPATQRALVERHDPSAAVGSPPAHATRAATAVSAVEPDASSSPITAPAAKPRRAATAPSRS